MMRPRSSTWLYGFVLVLGAAIGVVLPSFILFKMFFPSPGDVPIPRSMRQGLVLMVVVGCPTAVWAGLQLRLPVPRESRATSF
jgi:hypothetical protein